MFPTLDTCRARLQFMSYLDCSRARPIRGGRVSAALRNTLKGSLSVATDKKFRRRSPPDSSDEGVSKPALSAHHTRRSARQARDVEGHPCQDDAGPRQRRSLPGCLRGGNPCAIRAAGLDRQLPCTRRPLAVSGQRSPRRFWAAKLWETEAGAGRLGWPSAASSGSPTFRWRSSGHELANSPPAPSRS